MFSQDILLSTYLLTLLNRFEMQVIGLSNRNVSLVESGVAEAESGKKLPNYQLL